VSAEMAVKLASALNTSALFWLNAQQAIDIYENKVITTANNKSRLGQPDCNRLNLARLRT